MASLKALPATSYWSPWLQCPGPPSPGGSALVVVATAPHLLPRGSREGEKTGSAADARHSVVALQGPLCAGSCPAVSPAFGLPRGLCMSMALGPTLTSGQAASSLLLEQLGWDVTLDPSFPSWGAFPRHRPQTTAPGVE